MGSVRNPAGSVRARGQLIPCWLGWEETGLSGWNLKDERELRLLSLQRGEFFLETVPVECMIEV